MNTNEKNTSCQIGCWALAAGIGLVVFAGILVFGDMGWLGAIFLSGLAFGVSVLFSAGLSVSHYHLLGV